MHYIVKDDSLCGLNLHKTRKNDWLLPNANHGQEGREGRRIEYRIVRLDNANVGLTRWEIASGYCVNSVGKLLAISRKMGTRLSPLSEW